MCTLRIWTGSDERSLREWHQCRTSPRVSVALGFLTFSPGLVAAKLESLARLLGNTDILIMSTFAFFIIDQVKPLLHFLATGMTSLLGYTFVCGLALQIWPGGVFCTTGMLGLSLTFRMLGIFFWFVICLSRHFSLFLFWLQRSASHFRYGFWLSSHT